MGRKVKITVTESRCRDGFHREGQEFIIDKDKTMCPPMCMELCISLCMGINKWC